MKLLLDTHAMYWFLADSKKLSATADTLRWASNCESRGW